jgi:hypothetical protein
LANTIVLGCNIFNDICAVKRCWPTIIPLIDMAIIVDGSYPEFPTPYDYSVDGTVDWIRDAMAGKPVKILRYPGRRTEVEKRTAYLRYVDEHLPWNQTWLLVWDGDMALAPAEGYVMKDVEDEWRGLRNDSFANLVKIKVDIPYSSQCTKGSNFLLGFRNMPGMRYTGNHATIIDREDVSILDRHLPTVELIKSKILHYHLDKPRERIDERTFYSTKISRKYES